MNKKGITLVALVITVIVLLILAGVVISIGVGSNGLFERTNNAVAKWNSEVAKEETKLSELIEVLETVEDGVRQVNDEHPGILEGAGTQANPFTINSIEDLVAFAYNVNKGDTEYGAYSNAIVALGLDLDIRSNKSYRNPNTKYILGEYGYTPNESGAPIKQLLTDTNGIGFVPIGNGESIGFAGVFDGQDYSIYNLYENSNSYGGLFGQTSNDIVITDLVLSNCNLSAKCAVGGFLGYTDKIARIINCVCSGQIAHVGNWSVECPTRRHHWRFMGERFVYIQCY